MGRDMCGQEGHDVSGQIVYFSKRLLIRRNQGFFDEISAKLNACGIGVRLLLYTQDIWCRDYMPVRVGKEKFVQFKYDSEYLKTKRWRKTRTNPEKVCKTIGIKPVISDIILDGGNVVRCGDKVIMTWQVFNDNPAYSQEELESKLKVLLRVNDLIIIPPEPDDPFCHADGSVRFIRKDLVAINKTHKRHLGYDALLREILKAYRLSWIELPYSIDDDKRNKDSAVGNYVNYLAVGDAVFVPAYKGRKAYNQEAVKTLSRWFKQVIPIESTAIAKEGGILNCVSWGEWTDAV